MSEKFTVIEGGKHPESNPLAVTFEKLVRAIAPFTNFDDIVPELSDIATYNNMSDSDLAYEAELLSSKLKNPGIELGDLINRAVALRECITFRLQAS